MGELFGRILDALNFLWPLHRVYIWERAIYYEGGKPIRELAPGLWLFIPWFTEIRAVSTVPDIALTPRLDITLADGTTLTFGAEADYTVTDIASALNTVQDYHHRVTKHLAGILSSTLAEQSSGDLASGVRPRLLTTIRGRLNKETETYGCKVTDIWFTTFVLRVKTFRLLGDGHPTFD